MAKKLEIFECTVYICTIEIECFKPKTIYSRFQMDDMHIIDIAPFEVKEGKNRVNLFTGIQFIARINCLEAFQSCPLYIYFCNAQSQTICACGFDMSPLIVDAVKNSSSENNRPITYAEKLILQNRYDQKIGIGRFEFSCRHFSQDLSIIQSFVEEAKPAKETNVITEQPQLEENARSNAIVMTTRSKKRYQMPIMKDLLVLTKKYQKSSNGLVDEVESLENEVRMIEKRQNMILQKKNQQQRRKIDIHQPLTQDTSSTHTSDFSYFENSSDYSYNSIMNQTFKDVEKTCGKSFSHHKTHHNRHKEHHHHHHHKKETKEPEKDEKQEKQDSQIQSAKQDQISAKSSKISQNDFDAFIQRQNAATERRRSFIALSENDSKSFASQNSQLSSRKLAKPKPDAVQQQQQSKPPETAQTQIVGSQQKPKQEQPTSQTTKPKESDKSDAKTAQSSKSEQKQEKEDKKKDEESIHFSSDDNKSKNQDISSSRISNSSASSKKSKSSSKIEPVSTVETLDIPSDSSASKSSARSKSSVKSSTSKASESSKISVSSKTSKSSKSSKSSKASSSSKGSSHHSSLDEDFVDEPTTSNVIDVEQSSHIDIESSQKLSFTATQETLDIDDDDVVDVEQKSSTNPSTTGKSTSTSTKEKTKPSKSSSGVEFSNDLSKNDTENISPSDSEMENKDEHSSITESFISKKSNSGEETKTKHNLDDINLSELLDELNDPSAGNSSFTSELRNDLGIDEESIIDLKSKKNEKKEESTPPPAPLPKDEEKEEVEEKKSSVHKDQISELQSGIDIDDIFSD